MFVYKRKKKEKQKHRDKRASLLVAIVPIFFSNYIDISDTYHCINLRCTYCGDFDTLLYCKW